MANKLVYKENFEKNAYSLIELSTPELQEAFVSGNSIVIKGLAEDEAVLCTDSKTFIVRQVNTSNSIILMQSNHNQHIVHDDLSNTIELLPCLARTNRIDELLRDTCFAGVNNEKNMVGKTLYSYHDLLSVIQASENELLDALQAKGAFEHEGHFRLFDKSYLFRLFDSLVTNAILHGSDFKCMSLKEAKICITEEMNAVEEDESESVPDHVLVACINTFVLDPVDAKNDDALLAFDHRKICRFLGEWLLTNPRNKRWELNDFMEVWKKLGQDVFIPKLEYLDGLYIMNERAKLHRIERDIQYFPVSELSTDPPQRFSALFAEKPLWTSDEIIPFLVDLAPKKKEQELLLLKYARTHKTANRIQYGSRIK